MKHEAINGTYFCPQCDRLFDNYNAALERSGAAALAALKDYDTHRDTEHLPEAPAA